MTPVTTSHIWLDEQGRAWIDDINTKVIEVVLDHLGYGMTPEQMHEGHPHWSMAQIHAALAYYYDHKAEFDAEIERQNREIEKLRAESMNSPIRQKLRAMGRIP